MDTNQVQEMGGTANFTSVKWSSTDQAANYRMNSGGITVNGMDLHNMPLTLIAAAAALNGLRFYNSGYTPVSLPAVAPSNPRIYTDWDFLGSLPLMNNFSGNANYVEFVNFGNWDGFRLATNAAVNMAVRFTKAVSMSVLDEDSSPVNNAVIYRLDTNNGSRVTYTADEHFIQSTVGGIATGKILAQIGRLPAGAANNSTQYTAFMDYRNAANDGTGADKVYFASYEHLLSNRSVNTKRTGVLQLEQTVFADPNVTLDRASAVAKLASDFTINPVTKTVTPLADFNYDDLYDVIKAYKATPNAINVATPTLTDLILSVEGKTLKAFVGWSLLVPSGVTGEQGVKFTKVTFENITILGSLTGLYETTVGKSLRIHITNLG
jgi:hypothetical protein